MSTSHIQSVPQKPTRFERAKDYVKKHQEPLSIGFALGATFVVVFVTGSRLDKDLLVLKHKQLKQFKTIAQGTDHMPGVEYNIRGTRCWLIPALLPESETPYV